MRKFNSIEIHIDAENVSSKKIGAVFSRISKYGNIRVKHCYADFSNPIVKPWLSACNEYSITPCQANTIVTGKNTSDLELVRCCTKSMYQGKCDLMVIISSDSDFTSTVRELRETGIYTIGVGERKTPRALQNSYNEFWFFDEFISVQNSKKVLHIVKSGKSYFEPMYERKTPQPKINKRTTLDDIVAREIQKLQQESHSNWILVSKLGTKLKRCGIEFDIGLNDFVRNHERFILTKDYVTDAWLVTLNRKYQKSFNQ